LDGRIILISDGQGRSDTDENDGSNQEGCTQYNDKFEPIGGLGNPEWNARTTCTSGFVLTVLTIFGL
jgi:hypothetical protein